MSLNFSKLYFFIVFIILFSNYYRTSSKKTRNVKTKQKNNIKEAIVSLVTSESGYVAGALALGQSIKDVKTRANLVLMVTNDVNSDSRKKLSKNWEVVVVEAINCNHKHNLNEKEYDLNGEQYQAGISRWSHTCTKFAAWKLIEYDRIIFLDSDTLVVQNIDDAFRGYTNSSFAAAPESFPPDTFNSGRNLTFIWNYRFQ